MIPCVRRLAPPPPATISRNWPLPPPLPAAVSHCPVRSVGCSEEWAARGTRAAAFAAGGLRSVKGAERHLKQKGSDEWGFGSHLTSRIISHLRYWGVFVKHVKFYSNPNCFQPSHSSCPPPQKKHTTGGKKKIWSVPKTQLLIRCLGGGATPWQGLGIFRRQYNLLASMAPGRRVQDRGPTPSNVFQLPLICEVKIPRWQKESHNERSGANSGGLVPKRPPRRTQRSRPTCQERDNPTPY